MNKVGLVLRYIGFCKKPYIDKCDKLGVKNEEYLLSNKHFKKTYSTDGNENIRRLKDEFGLGMCTSCGYKFF